MRNKGSRYEVIENSNSPLTPGDVRDAEGPLPDNPTPVSRFLGDDGRSESPDPLAIEVCAESPFTRPIARVTDAEKAKILQLHHAEKWPIGTIAQQLGRHHETIERVPAQSGLPVQKQSTRKRKVDDFVPFIVETLEKYPRLRASRLWAMAKARGYTGSQIRFRGIVAQLRVRPASEAFLRRAVLPRHKAQVDWAHFGTITVGRAKRDLFAFVIMHS
jgi:hypothetical protein